MRKRRMDKVSRMERARARAAWRRALGALKWAAVVAAAWAVSEALCGRAAGGLSRFDAGVIFVSIVVLWAILESLARDIAGAARERMRVRTRARVLEMRARRRGRTTPAAARLSPPWEGLKEVAVKPLLAMDLKRKDSCSDGTAWIRKAGEWRRKD